MKDKEGKGASGSQARIFPAIRSIGKSVLSPLLKSLRGKTKVNGSAQHLPGAREETRNRSEDIKWLLKLGDENSLDMDRLAPSILDSAVFFGRAEAAGRVLSGFAEHRVTTTYLATSTGIRR
ncbi:MAG: hypothetical protein M0033_00675, partial [Nitrospiraceae bacterium]|nr:hypothetical protein [Nitrospiraceae bacterium]